MAALLTLLGLVVPSARGGQDDGRPLRIAQAEQSILKVKADVDGATVLLDGAEIGVTPAIRMVEPGPHQITIIHPWYAEYHQALSVVAGQAVTVDADLDIIVGHLIVSSSVDPARVYLDGKDVGSTPDLGLDNLTMGEHEIRVEKAGYLTYSGKVRVQAGLRIKLNVQLRANAAQVRVVTNPPGAEVRLDGERVGVSPLVLSDVTGGRHGLSVTIPGRSTVLRTFQVRVGDDIEVAVEVPERSGDLKVKASEDGAEVFVEGTSLGLAPVRLEGVAPGTYSVRVSREGFADAVETVQVPAGRTGRAKVKLISEEEYEQQALEGGPEADRPLRERRWLWAVAGGVVAAGAGGGTWYLVNQSGGPVTTPGDVAVTLP